MRFYASINIDTMRVYAYCMFIEQRETVMNGALLMSVCLVILSVPFAVIGELGWVIVLVLWASAIGCLAAVITERDTPGGSSVLFPGSAPKDDIHVSERRAISDAAIAAMRDGSFYGNGKEVVAEARKPFKGITH